SRTSSSWPTRWAASDCAVKPRPMSMPPSRRRCPSTIGRWWSTSPSARTPWSGRWWPPARPTTRSRRPVASVRTSTPVSRPSVPAMTKGSSMSIHTLSVLVENKPGVLARVSGLFSRRGFNIESLAVGPTEHPEISRITILVSVQGNALEQVTKQLNKLINVLKIVELEPDQAVQRELLLVKVRADETNRGSVVDIVELFNAKVVDVSPEALTIEMVG